MDYEREEAKEWRLTTGVEPRASRPRQVPNLVVDPDTIALTAWRRNDQPAASITIPKEVAPDHNLNRRIGNEKTLFSHFPEIRRISLETQTHISVESVNNRGMFLNLWGKPENVTEAESEIRKWIHDEAGRQKTRIWAKIPSYTPELRMIVEKEIRQDAERQKYKRGMLPATLPNHVGIFQWPIVDDWTPEQHLGNSLEALDPIRMEYSCWISYDASSSMLKVMGSKNTNVRLALTRVRASFYQVAARRIDPVSLRLVKPLSHILEVLKVKYVPYTATFEPLAGTGAVPKVSPQLERSQIANDESDGLLPIEDVWAAKDKDDKNMRDCESAIVKSLKRLQYYRANLTMSAEYGTFLLTKWKPRVETVEDFEAMVKDTHCEGEVTSEVGDISLEHSLLDHFSGASQILDAVSLAELSLHDIKPVYGATFVLKTIKNETIPLLRLDVEYQADFNNHFDRTSTKWSRIDHESGELAKLLDISFTDLDKSFAWNLSITAGHLVDVERFPRLTEFHDGVKMLDSGTGAASTGTGRFIEYKRVPSLQLISLQQKTIYRYRLRTGDYKCELAKLQDFTPAKTRALDKEYSLTPGQERWGVRLVRDQWARNLDENAHTGIGQGATWTPTLETFFEDGFAGFRARLDEIEGIILKNFSARKLAALEEMFPNLTRNKLTATLDENQGDLNRAIDAIFGA